MDEVKSVSVMEGDSVTLFTDLTEIQKAELILWTFGSDSTRIAQINRLINKISYYDGPDERFRDRLKLDSQTGSLTITNTTTQHAGLYQLQFIGGKPVTPKKFSVMVSARLPIPVISSNSSQCSSSSSSSSYCSLVCSVVNVGHVTLSWYKGNSLLSSISVSDLSISLSLPLEVEYQEKNSYSCVINNPITNQTTHLDISKLCHTCSAPGLSAGHIALVCFSVLAVVLVLCGIFCGIFFYYHHRRSTQADHQSKPYGEENIRLTNADGETLEQERHLQNNNFVEKDEIKSVIAMVGERVTLHTDLTEIKEDELIRWKFADSKIYKFAEFFVIAKWDKTNNEEYLHDDHKFKDRLHLDHNTGSLIITNITPKHYGHYKLHITSEGRDISKTFNLVAHDPKKRPGTILRRETCP
ncbi:SLAM family member 5-like isoform X1 [Carassius gibelio]|uniref:SLAM family member 5-like isoform X1 n=1 Tax=Carassius gibelio TaxID=101364 RepID=UPI002278770C|nr:SLAM family member 5-like isoform X1 [Carassius gibelio]